MKPIEFPGKLHGFRWCLNSLTYPIYTGGYSREQLWPWSRGGVGGGLQTVIC